MSAKSDKRHEVVFLDSPERHFFMASSYWLEKGEYFLENAEGEIVARIPSKNVRYIHQSD